MLSIVGLSSCLGGVEFELNFVVDGEIYDTVTTNGKEIVRIPDNPAKEGYTFDGWYWDKDEWNKPFTANSLLDAPLSSDMSVYAKWNCVHSASDWIIDSDATCKAAGSKHKECTECEEVLETEEIEKLTTHTPAEAVKENYVDSDCKTEGSYNLVVYCSVCEKKLSSEAKVVEKKEHTPSGWITDSEATCKTEGTKHKECTECEEVLETGTIEKLTTHTPAGAVKENFVDSNCETEGSYNSVVYCSVCEAKLSSEAKVVEKKDHTPSGWIEDTPATCKTEGTKHKECTECEEVLETGTIEKLTTHTPAEAVKENFVDSDCETEGSYNSVVYCSVCEAKLSSEAKTVEKKQHIFDQTNTDSRYLKAEATCTASARYYYSCSCGERGTADFTYGEPDGHNFVDCQCNKCGVYVTSKGLKLVLNSDNSSYTLKGIGSFSGGRLVIDTYEGLPITIISNSAFENCTVNITEIIIGNSVQSIGDYAFEDCSNVTNLVIGNNVTSIGEYAFSRCTRLRNLIIPSSVKSIGNFCFSYCMAIESVTIPSTVETLGAGAFSTCEGLVSVNIESGITSIEGSTFSYCINLVRVTIPATVESIGNNAFYGCKAITSVDIPNASVGDSAFSGCQVLKTVTLGDGVTSIGSSAFSGCVMLETIFIPINVTTINSLAFNGCKSLVVYCETSSWPSGWKNRWNNSVYSVVWGCKKQI